VFEIFIVLLSVLVLVDDGPFASEKFDDTGIFGNVGFWYMAGYNEERLALLRASILAPASRSMPIVLASPEPATLSRGVYPPYL
jgi:hypothetical protein